MPKGSNDLNALLKARVVKLRAELDLKKSLPVIKNQVDRITTLLESRPVRLRVKLESRIGELNKQISEITTKLQTAKTAKPLRLRVEIDVAGSAKTIQTQLDTIHKTVDNFNKKYGKQVAQMQAQTGQMQKMGVGVVPTDARVINFNAIKRYAEQLKEVERIMRSKVPKGAGLFSSFEVKDAQGNVKELIGTLEQANGVIDKTRFKFNSSKGAFELIDRTTLTNTQKQTHQAMKSLQDLEREISKTGNASKEFRAEYEKMMRAGADGNLTKDQVSNYATRLKNQEASVIKTREENRLLQERKTLLKEANSIMGKVPADSKYAQQVRDYKRELRTIPKDAFKTGEAKIQMQQLAKSIREVHTQYKEQRVTLTGLNAIREKSIDLVHRVHSLERRHGAQQEGALTARGIAEIDHLNKRIAKTRDLAEAERLLQRVQSKVGAMNRQSKDIRQLQEQSRIYDTLIGKIRKYFDIMGGAGAKLGERRIQSINKQLEEGKLRMDQLANMSREYTTRIEKLGEIRKKQEKKQGTRKDINAGIMGGFVDKNELDNLKKYVSEVENAQVSTAQWVRGADGMKRVTMEFEATGKNARRATYEIDQANKAVRLVRDGMFPNRRENLGVFEQLRIAMARVPVWMGAMTVFYGSIRSVRNMSREILELDRVMTEFRRVASDKINLEYAFDGAINLAKELGNEVHGVTQTLADFARTYGEFNERQLIAITKTATLMSNVSNMEVEQSAETLIATMNAFNITAEDSVRIVDSLNEVDNNYSVSTEQLAEGLQRSANVARTFGKLMPTYAVMHSA